MFKQLNTQQLQKINGGTGLQARRFDTERVNTPRWLHWIFKH